MAYVSGLAGKKMLESLPIGAAAAERLDQLLI